MHEAMPILLGVLVFGVFVVWAVAGNKAEHKDIEDWAVHNGFHLLKVKRRLALLSPFRWDLSMQVNKRENPYVFYVEVLTQERRSVTHGCGSTWAGRALARTRSTSAGPNECRARRVGYPRDEQKRGQTTVLWSGP